MSKSAARDELQQVQLRLAESTDILARAAKRRHWRPSERKMLDWLSGAVLCRAADELQAVLDGERPDAPAPESDLPGLVLLLGQVDRGLADSLKDGWSEAERRGHYLARLSIRFAMRELSDVLRRPELTDGFGLWDLAEQNAGTKPGTR